MCSLRDFNNDKQVHLWWSNQKISMLFSVDQNIIWTSQVIQSHVTAGASV